jgi:hypothetical protein
LADTNSDDANFDEPERTLRALALELKRPLTNIARRAELGGTESSVEILDIAERSLALIDSYLLMAQTEYGQIALALEPLGLGSVLHEVAYRLRPRFVSGASIIIDDRAHSPVMTNRLALTSAVVACVDMLSEDVGLNKQVILRSYKSSGGRIGVGVFTDKSLSAEEVKKALELQGRAQMPLSSVSSRSGVSLVIADCLCRAVGGSLKVKRMGKLIGLATLLPKSEQLSFI